MPDTTLNELLEVLGDKGPEFGRMEVRDVRLWHDHRGAEKCVTVSLCGTQDEMRSLFYFLAESFPNESGVRP